MGSFSVRLDLRRINTRIHELLRAYGDIKAPMQEAADYMVRASRNRIYRDLGDPETGARWEDLADKTVDIKGHDRPLIHTGTLAQSIQAIHVNRNGFTIRAPARNERGDAYASWMQDGFRGRGGKPVPARPFLGFSETNRKRIAQIVSRHLRNALNPS